MSNECTVGTRNIVINNVMYNAPNPVCDEIERLLARDEPDVEAYENKIKEAADEIERLTAQLDNANARYRSAQTKVDRLTTALESLRMSAQGQDDGWIIDVVDEALKDGS